MSQKDQQVAEPSKSDGKSKPEGNETADERLEQLNALAVRLDGAQAVAARRSEEIKQAVQDFTTMLGQITGFESAYGRAEEAALKKRFKQTVEERLAEAKAALEKKSPGAVAEVDRIRSDYSTKREELEEQVKKQRELVKERQADYDRHQKDADAIKAAFDALIASPTTADATLKSVADLSDQVNAADVLGDFAGMYLYAREWHQALAHQHAPSAAGTAAELNQSLVAYDRAMEAARRKKASLDDAQAALASLEASLTDVKNNRMAKLIARVHAKWPAPKPATA